MNAELKTLLLKTAVKIVKETKQPFTVENILSIYRALKKEVLLD